MSYLYYEICNYNIYNAPQRLNVLILFADRYHSLVHPRCNKFLLLLSFFILFADRYQSLGHPRCNKFLLQINYSVRAIVDGIVSCLSIRKSLVICPRL